MNIAEQNKKFTKICKFVYSIISELKELLSYEVEVEVDRNTYSIYLKYTFYPTDKTLDIRINTYTYLELEEDKIITVSLKRTIGSFINDLYKHTIRDITYL